MLEPLMAPWASPVFPLHHGASGPTAAPGCPTMPRWPPGLVAASGLTAALGGPTAPPSPPGHTAASGPTVTPGGLTARGTLGLGPPPA
jgi:hypothetical protein